MEYDPQAMRTALTRLRNIEVRLNDERAEVYSLEKARPPGTAPATNPFHQQYLKWAAYLHQEHDEARKETHDAIEALAAIDREYNNGEIASELGFNKINQGGG